jgi:hypothetical protein
VKTDEVRFREEHDDYLRDAEARPTRYFPHTVIVGRVDDRRVAMWVSDELRELGYIDVMPLVRQRIREQLIDED